MTEESRVRINLGKKSGTEDKPASRVRINLRDESLKHAEEAEEKEPSSRVRISLEGKKG
ncbi:hypothetical protein [Streptomyces sp. NPDC088141]|uniref:hypothetical protein n=1 Tax=unclassified Streptomyces TaxID=2593676 RepID=UPI0034343155